MMIALGYVDDGEHLLFPLDIQSLQEFQVVTQGYESLLQGRVNNQNASSANRDHSELNEQLGMLSFYFLY